MRRFAAIATCLAACGDSPASDPGWMATAPDDINLAALSIPGTHDSAALSEPIMGAAKTQLLDIAQQLDIGVRYLDIRCRNVADALEIYHGVYDEMQTFDDVLAAMFDYLDHHKTEALIVSVKLEVADVDSTRDFEATFRSYVDQNPDRWYLTDAVPALGDVRGKLVLVRRFPAQTVPLGIDASGWKDDTTFTLITAGATLRIEDQYTVSSTDAKWTAIQESIDAARAAAAADPTLFITFTSGFKSTAGVPNTPVVSSVIDPMLLTYLEAIPGDAHLGIVAMDFADGGHVSRMLATNANVK